jgi:hypothetical protein
MNSKTITPLVSSAFAFCFILLLQACSPAKPGIYKNDQIPSGTRSKLHDLNADLLSALKTNIPQTLEMMMSQELIDDRHERLTTTEQISIRMKTGDYSLMSEYYIVNQPGLDKGKNIIHERDLGINNFDLTFNRGAHEMYIALFTAKTAPQKWMITATYHKYDYGWKVDKLEINPYAENGKTAPELMEQAKEQLKNGYWLDASNTASFAVNCLRPYSYWNYVAEPAIYKFNTDALMQVMAHYKLPLLMKDVPTHPRIWRIRVERTPEGSFPNVNYISNIKLYDKEALKKENDVVGKAIGNVMTGIDKDKKYIYYTIYNETPKGVPYNDHYDLKQTLK